jgi:hypothetical protein
VEVLRVVLAKHRNLSVFIAITLLFIIEGKGGDHPSSIKGSVVLFFFCVLVKLTNSIIFSLRPYPGPKTRAMRGDNDGAPHCRISDDSRTQERHGTQTKMC